MSDGPTILIVSPSAERRERAEAALAGSAEVIRADSLATALEEISVGRMGIAVIDGDLPENGAADLLSALGSPGRAILWTAELRPDLVDYGAFVQLPHDVDDRSLADAALWLLEVARSAERARDGADREGELDRILDVVSRARHDMNNPLTAILAEVQLLLMDADQLSEEHRRSLRTVEEQTQRLREMVKTLQALKRT